MHYNFGPLRVLIRALSFHRFGIKLKIGSICRHRSQPSPHFCSCSVACYSVRFCTMYADAEYTDESCAHSSGLRTLSGVQESGALQLPKKDECGSVTDTKALMIQILLKTLSNRSEEELSEALDNSGLPLNEDLVLNVLRRHRSDWRPAFRFFNSVSKRSNRDGYSPGSGAYNEMIGILGRMGRFDEMHQLLDEMSERVGVMNERSYGIVVHRYAAAHKIEDATNMFYKRREYGLKLDLVAFQTLLMSLCRYKHVEAAEYLFHSRKGDFTYDIKTWNIILNGWCVLGSLREAKRFWNEIIRSRSKPDRFTYGIFINSLSKSGKISTAVKLFRQMWEKGCTPDVAICNCVIDGLCFKKRVPEALEVMREMDEKDCHPNVVTYNSLIKHLCRIRRMEKVYELLDEMERKKGDCAPNARTYGYLLKCLKKPEDVPGLLERMERSGCKMTGDTCNLLLRLYVKWEREEDVQSTWSGMERDGIGPDQRSYTVMIHGLHDGGRIEEALRYFEEMTRKGMVPEPRTRLLVDAMNIKLKERRGESACKDDAAAKLFSQKIEKKGA